MKQIFAGLTRNAARFRAGVVLLLIGEGLRLYSRQLPGALPAPIALAGMISTILAVVMVWSGLEGFMSLSMQGFDLLNGESPPEDE